MTYEQIAEMVSKVNIPYAYRQFDKSVVCPFICFYYSNRDDFIADGANYKKVENLVVELYTDEKDFELEETVENIFDEYGLVVSKIEAYIDSEKMYMITYESEVMINEQS